MRVVFIWGFLFCLCIIGEAQEPDKKKQPLPLPELTERAHKAIEKGIEWLIKNQNNDGSWGCEKGQPPSVALTGMAVMALLAAGHSPTRGPYAENIRSALAWLENIASKNRVLSKYDSTTLGDRFEHACGTLMLAHIYGMFKEIEEENEILKSYLRSAVEKLEKMQNRDGGWGRRGMVSDVGVTCMAYLAIRIAYSTGVKAGSADLKKIEKFLKTRRNILAHRYSGYPIYPLSAYLRIAYGLGKADSEDVKKATKRLLKMKLGRDRGRMSEWDYLGAFYSVGALAHAKHTDAWRKWFSYVRDFLIKIQRPEGCWIVEYCLHCKVFATDLALLTLLTGAELLPLYQY